MVYFVMCSRTHMFELFRFDYMISQNFEVYFIEVRVFDIVSIPTFFLYPASSSFV